MDDDFNAGETVWRCYNGWKNGMCLITVASKQYSKRSLKSNRSIWNLRYRWKQEALLDDDIQALIDERLGC